MTTNPLRKLQSLGQSIWLDDIGRELIGSGELRRLIEADGLSGITSNPAIFERSITGSRGYDEDIRTMALQGKAPMAIYEALSQRDVRSAADELMPRYESTDAADGYVSLEVNPHLAHDADGTVAEARRLWAALDRPNVMIKVPATVEGLLAIRQLIREGINVNATLLFGLPRYHQVADAYIGGLEDRVAQGGSPMHVASVASFFVSRIDQLVDPLLEELVVRDGVLARSAQRLLGQVAIASAKSAYRIYRDAFGGRFEGLREGKARTQRLLWASTGTKNPAHEDTKYVEALIGADTVNTLAPETLAAYRDHGDPRARLGVDAGQSATILSTLATLGIGIDQVTQRLEDEGVRKFTLPFDKLLATLSKLAGSRPGTVIP